MTDVTLDVLLEYLKRARGFDFSGYKRTSLERRIRKRMGEVGSPGYAEYLDHLEVNPDEFAALFDAILVNVTAFFRDGPAWDYLAAEVLPPLLEGIPEGEQIRVWCAGCASGEEPYSVAILLAEALGEPAYRDRVKIYATDIDEEALDRARHAAYPAKAVENVPREIAERYFDRVDQRHVFRKDLRRAVIFGRNDLVHDAPISRVDLLTCRNTLIYLNAETQAQVLARFNFALNDRGYLFLGKSEMLVAHAELFAPASPKRRIFRKVPRPASRERVPGVARERPTAGLRERDDALRAGVDDVLPAAQIAVDDAGVLVLANKRARDLFNVAPADVGRPLKDLEISYRPVELRSHLQSAYAQRHSVVVDGVAAAVATGDVRDLEVHVSPVLSDDVALGASIVFVDVTQQRRLREELDKARRELEGTYEQLQATVEELETTNEELQSTNEELETTNEELHATNVELETTNQELQSTNQELETINDELRTRTLELNEVNGFLEAVVTSTDVALAVVDRNQVVEVWNAQAKELWGARADEVEGRHLLALDIGLPLEELEPVVVSVLAGREARGELELQARDRRGRELRVRVTCVALMTDRAELSGAVLVMERLDAAAPRRAVAAGTDRDSDADDDAG
jgi:two-component system CheB/CheR fusion protein